MLAISREHGLLLAKSGSLLLYNIIHLLLDHLMRPMIRSNHIKRCIKADTNEGTASKTTHEKKLFTNCLGQAICCIFDLKVDSLCQAYGVPYTMRRQSSGRSNDGLAHAVDQGSLLHYHTKANAASKSSSSTSSTCTADFHLLHGLSEHKIVIPKSHV